MTEFNPKRIEDPYEFIGDLHDRLVGLKIDLENTYGKSESLGYHSRVGLNMVEKILDWMEAQQMDWIEP